MPAAKSYTLRVLSQLVTEVRSVTKLQGLAAGALVVCAYAYQFFFGSGLSIEDLVSVLVPMVGVVCLVGPWMIFVAARKVHSQDIEAWKSSKPIVIGSIKGPRPTSRRVAITAVFMMALLFSVSLGTIALVSGLRRGSSLSQMTNAELRQKATLVYQQINDLNEQYFARERALIEGLKNGEITQEQFNRFDTADIQKVADTYNRRLRIDATMVRLELRRRIPASERSHIPNYMPDIAPSSGGQPVNFGDIMGGNFSLFVSEALSREIEELAKLLP